MSGDVGQAVEMGGMEQECSGACLTGHDIGIPNGGVAYPQPDCPLHGDGWKPSGNEWSRQYVAAHPDRFKGASHG